MDIDNKVTSNMASDKRQMQLKSPYEGNAMFTSILVAW